MDLEIYLKENKKDFHNIEKITLPVINGQIQILKNHSETFVNLRYGKIILFKKQKTEEIVMDYSAVCWIKNNLIKIII